MPRQPRTMASATLSRPPDDDSFPISTAPVSGSDSVSTLLPVAAPTLVSSTDSEGLVRNLDASRFSNQESFLAGQSDFDLFQKFRMFSEWEKNAQLQSVLSTPSSSLAPSVPVPQSSLIFSLVPTALPAESRKSSKVRSGFS